MKKNNKSRRKTEGKGRGTRGERAGQRPAPTEGNDRNEKTKKGAQPCAPTGANDTRPSTAGRTPSAQDGGLAGMGRKKGGPSTAGRTPSAQEPGNSNARTHGLWAKYQPLVTEEEKDPNAGPEQRRDILDRVIKVLFMDFCEAEDTETRCRIANALCMAVTAANGCDRTLAIVVGRISPLQQAIEELLAEEDPDDYSTIEQSTFKGNGGGYVGAEDGMSGAGDSCHRHTCTAPNAVRCKCDAASAEMKGGASDGTHRRETE